MADYTTEDYRRMLINVLDANYGTGFHDIGNGDGLPPEEANEIIEFWRGHLHESVAAWRTQTDSGEGEQRWPMKQ